MGLRSAIKTAGSSGVLDIIPWNYTHFLDYAAERNPAPQQGGGCRLLFTDSPGLLQHLGHRRKS